MLDLLLTASISHKQYYTEYRVERFYPDYYSSPRPQPTGLPTSVSYGGQYFDVTLSKADLGGKNAIEETKVVLVRPGFSTHAMYESCFLLNPL